METQKKQMGRPITGTSKKISTSISVQIDTLEAFQAMCREMGTTTSVLIQEFMETSVKMNRSTFLIKNNEL